MLSVDGTEFGADGDDDELEAAIRTRKLDTVGADSRDTGLSR